MRLDQHLGLLAQQLIVGDVALAQIGRAQRGAVATIGLTAVSYRLGNAVEEVADEVFDAVCFVKHWPSSSSLDCSFRGIISNNTGVLLITTVDDVIAAARQLSPAEKLEIIQALSRELQRQYVDTTTASSSPSATQRIAGLDKGAVWMSDDFDDELPDEFWFGSDNESAS
jgi:hypothetical protein